MDISNRALAMFLLAAIVVSLAGTITSLNRLGSISTTGYASTDTGTVQLVVAGSLSITTADATPSINFVGCVPYPGGSVSINSENSSNTSGANGICGYASIQNITVRNDGTVDANVTIQSNEVGELEGSGSFLEATPDASDIAFKAENHSRDTGSTGGCSSLVGNVNAFTQYTNFTATGTKHPLCANLTWGEDTTNSLTTDFEIVVPRNVAAQTATATITYTAHTIV